MEQTYISFYLRYNNILIFRRALREIGEPKRICFMFSDDEKHFLIKPYDKVDFKSHKVPKNAYTGTGSMVISSKKLCRILANKCSWDISKSYRVSGIIKPEQKLVLFDLDTAQKIKM